MQTEVMSLNPTQGSSFSSQVTVLCLVLCCCSVFQVFLSSYTLCMYTPTCVCVDDPVFVLTTLRYIFKMCKHHVEISTPHSRIIIMSTLIYMCRIRSIKHTRICGIPLLGNHEIYRKCVYPLTELNPALAC